MIITLSPGGRGEGQHLVHPHLGPPPSRGEDNQTKAMISTSKIFLELGIWLLEPVLSRFKKLYFLAGGDRANGMFIDQLIRLPSEDDTEVVEAEDDSLHLMTCGQLDHHVFPVTPDAV